MVTTPSTPSAVTGSTSAVNLQCMEVWGGNQSVEAGVTMPGLDAWVFSVPHGEDAGGGDIHFVSSCATGRIVRLMLADVSGHGSTVSGLAINLRSLLRRYVNQLDQRRFLSELNREFAGVARIGTFATAVVATFWAPTGYLTLSNAGHPRPLLWRVQRRAWELLRDDDTSGSTPTNVPLGIIARGEYREMGVVLERGDLLLLYTDALIEAQDEQGALIGEDGLLDIVRGLDGDHPERIIPELEAALARYRGHRPAEDDRTMLLVRANGLRPRLTVRDRIESMQRLIGAGWASLMPGGPKMAWPDLNIANLLGYWIPALQRRWGTADRSRGSR